MEDMHRANSPFITDAKRETATILNSWMADAERAQRRQDRITFGMFLAAAPMFGVAGFLLAVALR